LKELYLSSRKVSSEIFFGGVIDHD